jgi:flavin reductase (DIM6/NTAB) family NADH-FMN oxidoreductase RutF
MFLDPASVSHGAFYQFMISVIVPRPIAFISTLDRAGRRNAAPFSFFAGLTSRPPLLGVSIQLREGNPKDTLRNIRETGEFVVNVVDEPLSKQMVQCSGEWADDVDELELTGLTTLPSERVAPPRIAESPVNLECRLHREVELGNTVFVVGEILCAHARDTVLTEGRVDPAKLRPIGRLGGDGYCYVHEIFHLPRPKVAR